MSQNNTSNSTVTGVLEELDIIEAAQLSQGAGLGHSRLLDGLTFAVKDMFAVAGVTSGFGSPDWKSSHEPSTRHATSIEQMLQAGAHLVATTVCDELAFSLDGINVHYGTPINPRAPERIPGGSSSGPASVVAQGLVDFALGTDTAGSTRVPASYCGIWGLRPTHGSISSSGVLPLGPSFDTVGLLAGTLDVLSKIATVSIEAKGCARASRLIIVTECFDLLDPALLPPVMALATKLQRLFKSCHEQSVVEDGLPALVSNFATIRGFEAWQCHGPWFESTAPALSPAVAKRLTACRGTAEKDVAASRRYRHQLQAKFRDLLDQTVLCLPTTAQIPPLISASDQELETNRSLNLRLNSIASFLGLPQITIPVPVGPEYRGKAIGPAEIQNLSSGRPAGTSSFFPGLSPGLSIIGAEGSEFELLRLGAELTNEL